MFGSYSVLPLPSHTVNKKKVFETQFLPIIIWLLLLLLFYCCPCFSVKMFRMSKKGKKIITQDINIFLLEQTTTLTTNEIKHRNSVNVNHYYTNDVLIIYEICQF